MPGRELVPVEVFKPGGLDDLLASIAREARSHGADISTDRGRKAIASVAYKVAQSKTLLDDMGKGLVAGWKEQSARVDAERRKAREFLDALKDEVRKPLTDFEEAEKARVAGHEAAIAAMQESPTFYTAPQSSDEFQRRLDYLRAYPERDWKEFAPRATATLAAEIALTEQALAAALAREAEAVELARLRAEADERRRQEEERARQERDARIAAEAADRARRDAEERAAAELRAAQAKVDEERRAAERARHDAAEAALRAERERKAAEERAATAQAAAIEAERKRVAAEAADAAARLKREAELRAADQEHRAKINREALAALVLCGLTEEAGRTVITAIARRQVPHISIGY